MVKGAARNNKDLGRWSGVVLLGWNHSKRLQTKAIADDGIGSSVLDLRFDLWKGEMI
jgi:hypothetical protein